MTRRPIFLILVMAAVAFAFLGGATIGLGMMLRTLNSDIARQIGEGPDLRGVVVTGVEPLSSAARTGIRARDVITHVQGQSVPDVNEFKRLLRTHDLGEGVRLTVRSGGAPRFVFLKGGE